MMNGARRKKRSPFWYVQYLDSDREKHDKSTGLRADDPNDTAKARILRAELEATELEGGESPQPCWIVFLPVWLVVIILCEAHVIFVESKAGSLGDGIVPNVYTVNATSTRLNRT
jgi:hypothetical protein